MRIAVLGGGPGGLYFASMWKARHPAARWNCSSRTPPTRRGASASCSRTGAGIPARGRSRYGRSHLAAHGDVARHHARSARRDGRHRRDRLLRHKPARASATASAARACGRRRPQFRNASPSLDELAGFDLIVAADGVNSLVRRASRATSASRCPIQQQVHLVRRQPNVRHADAHLCRRPTRQLQRPPLSLLAAMSTFLVECDRATWLRVRLSTRSSRNPPAICEEVFAATLQGNPLVSNRSFWRNFPWIWNDRWSFRNMVLIGDALRTAHFSIGSGTRLALEDALALAKALEATPGDLRPALARYESRRRPVVEKLVAASRQRRLVRGLCPAHAPRPDGLGHELHHPLGEDRRGSPAWHGAGIHGAL